MEKQELNNRKEAWDMALIKLAIPLSIIAFVFAKAKIKIKLCSYPKEKKKETDDIDEPKTEPTDKPKNKDQAEAEDRAVYCFGTAKLFEKRRKRIGFLNKLTKYVGLLIPLSFSLFYMSLENSSFILTFTPIFKYVALTLNVILLFISSWALIFDWDNRLENFTESISNNRRYFKIFKEIAERYNEDETKYANLYRETILLDDIQQAKDDKENFSAKDDRFIMREGLYQTQRECTICGKIPDINLKNCSCCGK